VRDFKVGFFILAGEEPTIHRKKFVAFCEELIARRLPVHWGINTRVTDILRDRDLLPLFRRAGLVHVSLGTEAAAQLQLDRFREELGDRVEVRDHDKYNFVTPIIQPDAMSREQVLKGVLKNYARFYLRNTFLDYPWIRDRFKRRYEVL
jgi:hypothetical protein